MLIINGQYKILETDQIYEYTGRMRNADRNIIRITISDDDASYEDISSIFVDGAQIIREFSRIEKEMVQINALPEDEEPSEGYEPLYEEREFETVNEYDLSEFCVAGDIVDKRDGTFWVHMCKRTDAEIKDDEMAALLLAMGGIE